jgi:sugar phosphate isomerase/epimerase
MGALYDGATLVPMLLSLHSVVLTGRVGWPAQIDLAAQVGFPAVDVNVTGAVKDGFAPTRDHLKTKNVRPGVMSFPVEFRKDEEAFKKDLDQLEASAQMAAALGCPRMATWILSSSDLPKDENRRLHKRRLGAAANILARSHVRLGLEFLGPLHIRKQRPHEFIWRMHEMLEFARECGPNVGLLLDAWHWHHAGATVADILKAGREGIVHVHFNDAAQQAPEEVKDNERLMPGEGVINLTAFLQALQKTGYRDGASVEVFGRGLKDMPVEEAARLSFTSAKAVFEKAGVPWK